MNDSNALELDASYEALRAIGPWLQDILEPLGPDRAQTALGSMELAIHELATNSIDHAVDHQGTLELRARLDTAKVEIQLTDQGRAFESEKVTAPETARPQVRGYGLMIIEQLVSSLDYERRSEENVWTAVFNV